MKKSLSLASFLVLIYVLFFSCHKVDKISTTPNIKFTSFQSFDTTDILGNQARGGRLKFHFEDGDGDIGLNPPSNPGDDSTNLFFKLYRVKNGALVPAADSGDPLKPSDYRIPYLTGIGQNSLMKGTISITFLYLFYKASDTIEYDFYIKDRAGHVSNTVSTCEVPIAKDTVCKSN